MRIKNELPVRHLMAGQGPDAQQLQNTWLHQLEKAQLALLHTPHQMRQAENRHGAAMRPDLGTDFLTENDNQQGEAETESKNDTFMPSSRPTTMTAEAENWVNVRNVVTPSLATPSFSTWVPSVYLNSSTAHTAGEQPQGGEPIVASFNHHASENRHFGAQLISMETPPAHYHQPESIISQSAEVSGQKTVAGEPWAKRHMHLFQSVEGVRVWIRDSEFNTNMLGMLIDALKEQLGQQGLQLSELTLNGQKVKLDGTFSRAILSSGRQTDTAQHINDSNKLSPDEIQRLVEHTIQSLG
ncbi:hypothetical protein HNQ59_003621 [Chitinivorax tropicus]|uniref:Uncharacterized protein n=1 Tax=Chitinivorax tropicus TaxID=714531 RepID=A0A840MU30_9PROT|nr:hypothetical protein [Chitinivorax tropicus]MBB5020302.1 hypothetical protein [Chitinivorax tropicus]